MAGPCHNFKSAIDLHDAPSARGNKNPFANFRGRYRNNKDLKPLKGVRENTTQMSNDDNPRSVQSSHLAGPRGVVSALAKGHLARTRPHDAALSRTAMDASKVRLPNKTRFEAERRFVPLRRE